MSEFHQQNVVWEEAVFHSKVCDVLRALRPLEERVSQLELIGLLQFTTGLFMAAEGLVFPEHPVHPQLKALADGFSQGIQLAERERQKAGVVE